MSENFANVGDLSKNQEIVREKCRKTYLKLRKQAFSVTHLVFTLCELLPVIRYAVYY